MRDVDAIQANLDSGRKMTREALLLALGSGNYGFWTGGGPFDFGGVTYVAAGKVLSGSLSTTQAMDGAAYRLEFSVSAIPDSTLSPDVLASIEDEDYKNRPVRVYKWYFDPDTRAFISARLRFAGQIDTFEHRITLPSLEQPQGSYALIGTALSRMIDNQRIGGARRTQAQQLLIDPDDTGSLSRVGTIGTETIPIGQNPASVSQQSAGSSRTGPKL